MGLRRSGVCKPCVCRCVLHPTGAPAGSGPTRNKRDLACEAFTNPLVAAFSALHGARRARGPHRPNGTVCHALEMAKSV
eukprot:3348796-Alexandrium_andersonii.AAC.1